MMFRYKVIVPVTKLLNYKLVVIVLTLTALPLCISSELAGPQGSQLNLTNNHNGNNETNHLNNPASPQDDSTAADHSPERTSYPAISNLLSTSPPVALVQTTNDDPLQNQADRSGNLTEIPASQLPTAPSGNSIQRGKCSKEIYSCKGRCGEEPRIACSCHWSCQIYGNCCEDFGEECVALTSQQISSLEPFKSATVRCQVNSLLISSCMEDLENKWEVFKSDVLQPKTSVGSFNMEEILPLVLQLDAEGLRKRCQEPDGFDYIDHMPVSGISPELHFANVYCALCNSISNVQPWTAFANCPATLPQEENPDTADTNSSPKNELSDLASMVFHNVDQIMEDEKCQLAWLPPTGVPNTCVSNEMFIDGVDTDGSQSGDEGPGSQDGVGNLESSTQEPLNLSDRNDYALAWNLPYGTDLRDNSTRTLLMERCERLLSPVEDPNEPGKIYRNRYCYLLHGNANLTTTLCEPTVSRINDSSGSWYTLHKSNDTASSVGWDVSFGVDEKYLHLLLGAEPDSECDAGSHVIIDGVCHMQVFQFYITLDFTFERSSVIRGDFSAQVEKFTQRVVDVFQGPLSETIVCVLSEQEQHKIIGSSVKFRSSVVMKCIEIARENQNNTSTDATTGRSVSLYRYTSFVDHGVKEVIQTPKLVTLPVSITTTPCVLPITEVGTGNIGYCSKTPHTWKIVRNVDSIIGGISLEGIITIICCVLSDIGLLVRLALQNVVPFYKSYPGKIQFSLCLSLLFAYTLFLIGGMVEEGSRSCMVIAALTHLAFVSALFWMNVTAFEIWRTFRHWRNQVVSRGNTALFLSSCYAVGLPTLVVVAALIIEELLPWSEFSPSYGEHFCWLNGTMAVAIYFVTPCSFICCMNTVFVGLTLRGLRRQRTSISEFKKTNTMTAVTDTTIVVKIIILVGVTWLLGLLAAVVDHQVLWIIFTIINASLGFLISAVLVFNKRVFYAVQAKCLCYNTESSGVVSTQVPRH